MSPIGRKAKKVGDLSCGGMRKHIHKMIIYDPYKKKIVQKRNSKQKYGKNNQQQLLNFRPKKEDKEWYGDKLIHKPNKNTTRFMLLNCNGISRSQDTNWFKSQITRIINRDVHYMALVEANIIPHNSQLKQRLLSAFSEIVPDGIFTLTNTKIAGTKHEFQPGGVASGFFGKLRNRYTRTTVDKMGRWICHHFEGKTKKLRVYSMYRVNAGGKGHMTAWIQQKTYLLKKYNEENPRHQIICDMIEEIKSALDDKCEVILMADLNEALDGREQSSKKFIELGLFNIFESCLHTFPRTCSRGS